jgi:transcriptional regulator of acetoin/glycerol metabolism
MAPTLTQDLHYLNPDDLPDSKTQSPREDRPANGPASNLSEAESVEVLRWARDYAPELLARLLTAYGHRARPPAGAKASAAHTPQSGTGAPPSSHALGTGARVDAGREGSTLKEVEREQIKRVLAESATLREAASKLGIDETTLWRKRKRYRIH